MTDVVRCVRCKLNQYWTSDSLCRRCRTPLPKIITASSIITAQVIPIEQTKVLDCVKVVSESLFTYREASHLTQMALGRRVQMGHATISRIEGRTRCMTLSVLEKLATGLQIPVTWLMQPVTDDRLAELFAREILLATRQAGVKLDAVRKLIALQQRRAG